jgi:hypothetical protein
VEEIWEHFKEVVFESIDHFVPHKILKIILILNVRMLRVKWLEVKFRKVCERKLGQQYQVELKRDYVKNCRQPKKLHRKHVCGQYYEMKSTAGLSSTSM